MLCHNKGNTYFVILNPSPCVILNEVKNLVWAQSLPWV